MKGISLLEILLSVAVIAVISTIFVGVFGSFRSSGDLEQVRANILGILKDARARTLASEGNTTYGIHFETAKTVLFKGSVYSSSDPSNEIYNLPASTRISSINLGGPVDTVFTRLQGTTTASGSITIQSLRTQNTRVITISATGNVQ